MYWLYQVQDNDDYRCCPIKVAQDLKLNRTVMIPGSISNCGFNANILV